MLPSNYDQQRSPMSTKWGQTTTACTEARRGWSRTHEQPSLGLVGSRAWNPPPPKRWRQWRELFKSHFVPFILSRHPGLYQRFSSVTHSPLGVLGALPGGCGESVSTAARRLGHRAGAEATAGTDPAGRGVAVPRPSTLRQLTHQFP